MKAISIITIFMLLGFFLSSCEKKGVEIPSPFYTGLTPEMKIKRGEYLVSIIGCDDCHSPKIFAPDGSFEVDMSRRLSGHPADDQLVPIADKSILKDYMVFSTDFTTGMGPWGTSYAANLTPDDTGIGNWTEEQFFKAIREGKSKGMDGTRPLLPPMPWFLYKNMSDDDLSSIFAYLKTMQPIKNVVPLPEPPANQ